MPCVTAIIPVYRDAERALAAVASLRAQSLPEDITLEIVVVDDGSADGSADKIRELAPAITVIDLISNHGRASARQAGIDAAAGEFVLFLDCDCLPVELNYVESHVRMLLSGCIASTGAVVGVGGTFWDRYQRAASNRRKRLFHQGLRASGTTSNLMVRKSALMAIGGFDLGYRQYGFEDRDLLLRLSLLGSIGWCEGATVRHMDSLSMASVASKMRIAARESAPLFAARHPEAYRALGYKSIDARMNPWLRVPASALAPIVHPLAVAFDAAERWAILPWPVAAVVARLLSAASYAAGTAESGDLTQVPADRR